jgi:hypothetical protein
VWGRKITFDECFTLYVCENEERAFMEMNLRRI